MTRGNSENHDFIVTLFAQGMIALQGLLVVPIIVKWAGASTYGAYVLLGSIISTSFGVLTAMQYLYRRKLVSARSVAERRALVDPQLSFHLAGLLIIAVGLAFTAGVIERSLIGEIGIVSWWILVALLVSMFIARQVQDYYRFTLRFGVFNFALVSPLYSFLIFSAVWALSGHILSINVLFLLQIAATLGVSLPFVVTIFREIGIPRWRLSLDRIRKDARSNFPFVVELVVDFLLAFSDRYLISIFLSVAAVAAYQPAYQLASLVLFVPRFAAVLLVPRLSHMIDRGQRPDAERLVETFMKFFLMIAVPFAVGILMVGYPLVALMTTPEIGMVSRWVAPVVTVGSICYGIVLLMDPVALALGRNRALLVAYAFGACVNLAVNLLLLPIFRDVHIAAISTLVGYAVTSVWIWVILRQDWHLRIDVLALLRYLIASVAMGLMLLMLGYHPYSTRMLETTQIVSCIAIGMIIYFAALWMIGGLGRAELREAAGLWKIRGRVAPET